MATNLIRVQRGKETRIVQRGMEPAGFTVVENVQAPQQAPKQDERPLNEMPPSYLKDVKNDDLRAFLDEHDIEHTEDMQKKDLIPLVQKA